MDEIGRAVAAKMEDTRGDAGEGTLERVAELPDRLVRGPSAGQTG